MPKRNQASKTTFKLESAQATLKYDPDEDNVALLDGLHSRIRGQGHASALLQTIIDFADKRGLYLWLKVQRYSDPHGGLDNSQLIRLYEKFGFDILNDQDKPVTMGRIPLLKGE